MAILFELGILLYHRSCVSLYTPLLFPASKLNLNNYNTKLLNGDYDEKDVFLDKVR